jgi:hypothetical protein
VLGLGAGPLTAVAMVGAGFAVEAVNDTVCSASPGAAMVMRFESTPVLISETGTLLRAPLKIHSCCALVSAPSSNVIVSGPSWRVIGPTCSAIALIALVKISARATAGDGAAPVVGMAR